MQNPHHFDGGQLPNPGHRTARYDLKTERYNHSIPNYLYTAKKISFPTTVTRKYGETSNESFAETAPQHSITVTDDFIYVYVYLYTSFVQGRCEFTTAEIIDGTDIKTTRLQTIISQFRTAGIADIECSFKKVHINSILSVYKWGNKNIWLEEN
ncbi:hypothetical protein [Sodalis sp. RH20]|uniref:hypothetical protein n=1 Tax=unclassified Sodalis (in: enterobacteria) TaxID=2636512 RepID=UPI0039B53D1D